MRRLPSFALALGASLMALPIPAATSAEQPNAPGANGPMVVNGTGNNGEPHQSKMANNGTWTNATANKSPAQRNPLLTDQAACASAS